MGHPIAEQHSRPYENMKKWFDDLFGPINEQFFRRAILKLVERSGKCVASIGHKFSEYFFYYLATINVFFEENRYGFIGIHLVYIANHSILIVHRLKLYEQCIIEQHISNKTDVGMTMVVFTYIFFGFPLEFFPHINSKNLFSQL